MLVIRQAQIDSLIKGDEDQWMDFLVGHVKKEDPGLVDEYEDDRLREMVRVALKKANHYGFTTAKDESSFVSIMFDIAPNFDHQPEIKAVLDESNLPPSYRLEKLWSDAVPDEVWERAADSYDEAAWNDEAEAAV